MFECHELDPLEEFFLEQTQKMGINRGLKMSGGAVTSALYKEIQQLYDHRVSIPVEPANILRGNNHAPLKYLMFIKQKRDGSIKGCRCDDVRPQHV